MTETKKLSELLVEEQIAKQEWEQAVQAVKAANELVGSGRSRTMLP
jgi:hypothetical protein